MVRYKNVNINLCGSSSSYCGRQPVASSLLHPNTNLVVIFFFHHELYGIMYVVQMGKKAYCKMQNGLRNGLILRTHRK